MTKHLTDRFVAGVRTTTRENYFDTKTRGLVLRVSTRGKVWYFTYRRQGPTQWLRLGLYPALGLADARTAALDQRHAVDVERKDPAAERRTLPPVPAPAPHVLTFGDFVPTFLAFQRKRVRTWRANETMLQKYLVPAWEALPLKSITRRHVHEVLDAAEGRGLTVGVNRLQMLISRIFTVALDREAVDAHPAARMIKRCVETPRETTLTDDALRQLWAGLDASPGAASDALRLRLLLGQRGEETAGMQWAELDLAAATWSLPRLRTKTKRPHVVALPPMALALLERRRAARSEQEEDEPRVFPGLALNSPQHKALSVLRNGAYTWKDARRTVATRLAELGFDETVIGRVLSHAKHSVTGKHYNQHRYVEEIRTALTAWDTELQRILRHEPKTRTNLLPMRSRG
jgi:integrase